MLCAGSYLVGEIPMRNSSGLVESPGHIVLLVGDHQYSFGSDLGRLRALMINVFVIDDRW